MACMEMKCKGCGANNMSNDIYKVCPTCKSKDIINWFDEEVEKISVEEIDFYDED